jgi:tRNA(fMet)-specific endonuclease VapC
LLRNKSVVGYLLDTQVITYWFGGSSGQFPNVQAAAEARERDAPLFVSAVSFGEISFGHKMHPAGAGPRRDEFLTFLRDRLPTILEISRHTAEPYGSIRAALANQFPPPGGWNKTRRAEQMYDPIAGRELGIQENDLWIVAQAAERNLVLVSSDKMKRIRDAVAAVVPGFVVENWVHTTTP